MSKGLDRTARAEELKVKSYETLIAGDKACFLS